MKRVRPVMISGLGAIWKDEVGEGNERGGVTKDENDSGGATSDRSEC